MTDATITPENEEQLLERAKKILFTQLQDYYKTFTDFISTLPVDKKDNYIKIKALSYLNDAYVWSKEIFLVLQFVKPESIKLTPEQLQEMIEKGQCSQNPN